MSLSTLGDIAQVMYDSFLAEHNDIVDTVVGYGSFFRQDQDAPIPIEYDSVPDMLVFVTDAAEYMQRIGADLGYSCAEIEEHVQNLLPGINYALVKTPEYFQVPHIHAVIRPGGKIGIIELEDLSAMPYALEQYAFARLKGPLHMLQEGSDAPVMFIHSARDHYASLARQMSKGLTSGRELLENYLGYSYLTDIRPEWYKVKKMMMHAPDILRNSIAGISIEEHLHETVQHRMHTDDAFLERTYNLTGHRGCLDSMLGWRGFLHLGPRHILHGMWINLNISSYNKFSLLSRLRPEPQQGLVLYEDFTDPTKYVLRKVKKTLLGGLRSAAR